MSRNQPRKSERTRARRPRTVSISLAERGQTTQDFAVGIGVFLLAIAFVFSFLPSVITPFDSSVGGAETAQADRIADLIVHNLSVSTDNPNEINATEFDETYSENLTEKLGLRASNGNRIDQVNVTVERLNNTEDVDPTNLTTGDVYDDQPAASSARIVTIEGGHENCTPACRLVVRVW